MADEFSIDVIIPNFNKKEYLEDAIDSVVNQSYKNWKLFVIDDNSTDGSKDLLKKYLSEKNINIILLKKNKGPSFCRNLGIRFSSSKYISFLDSDDFWTKDKLKKQIEFMKKNNFVFTYTDYTSFRENKKMKDLIGKTNLKDNFNFEDFTKNSSINTSTMMIERFLIKNIRFKKIYRLEDYLFKCQILKKNVKAFKLNESLAFYRILNTSRSSQKIKNIIYLWRINRNYNNFSVIKNAISIIMIALNSFKKYGLK